MFARLRSPFRPPLPPPPSQATWTEVPTDAPIPDATYRDAWDWLPLDSALISDEDVPERALRRDPAGVRVVPLRPASAWPERRAGQRLSNPFRAFPNRSFHLARMMFAQDDA